MARRTLTPALVLFLISPAIGELLSGSSPPSEFFTPFGLTMLLGLYGCGALVARELKVRWGKGMGSLLLLGAAYGVLEEGVMVASWFNPAWPDLGLLGVYGRWLGVNWVWATELTMYHAILSITVPVMLVELAFPDRKGARWLGDRMLKVVAVVLLLDVALGFVLFGLLTGYRPPMPQYLFAVALVPALAYAARRLPADWARRGIAPMRRPRTYFFIALLAALASGAIYWVLPNVPPISQIPLVAIILGPAVVLLTINKLASYDWHSATPLHRFALTSGSVFILIAFSLVLELDKAAKDNRTGMTLVGLSAMALLAMLGLKARRDSSTPLIVNWTIPNSMIPVVIREIMQATPTIKTLSLEPQRPFSFKAGQWLDFYTDPSGTPAGYSITSSPLDIRRIGLAVKDQGVNPVTRYVHKSAREGDTVWVDGGNGQIYYETGDADEVVLIAAGIGITPHMSILHLIDEGDDAKCTLIYSTETSEEFLFRGEIDSIALRNPRIRCLYTVTGDSPDWGGRRGRIDADMVRESGASVSALYYVCGPSEMIKDTVGILSEFGVRRKNMRYEFW